MGIAEVLDFRYKAVGRNVMGMWETWQGRGGKMDGGDDDLHKRYERVGARDDIPLLISRMLGK